MSLFPRLRICETGTWRVTYRIIIIIAFCMFHFTRWVRCNR